VTACDLTLAPGESAFVPAGDKAEITGTCDGAGTVFRATVVA
jgi:mannose-6-phosphate isomerase